MKNHIITLYLLTIPLLSISQTKNQNKTNYHYLKQKIDLCLAVEGDFLRTLGNIGVFFWNAGMHYEKDNEGNKIKNEYGNYVYLYPERKLDFIKNNFGANVKLDYL
jgi:hypothetical protein